MQTLAGGVTGTTNTTHGNKVQYKLDDGEWGDNVPEATEIGDYTIYYKLNGMPTQKGVYIKSGRKVVK